MVFKYIGLKLSYKVIEIELKNLSSVLNSIGKNGWLYIGARKNKAILIKTNNKYKYHSIPTEEILDKIGEYNKYQLFIFVNTPIKHYATCLSSDIKKTLLHLLNEVGSDGWQLVCSISNSNYVIFIHTPVKIKYILNIPCKKIKSELNNFGLQGIELSNNIFGYLVYKKNQLPLL